MHKHVSDPMCITEDTHTTRRPGMVSQAMCWLRRTSVQMGRSEQCVKEQEREEEWSLLTFPGSGLKWGVKFLDNIV